MRSQFCRHENGSNKHRYRAKHVGIERYQVEVIIQHDRPERYFVLYEVVILFGKVDHADNQHAKQHHEEERRQEFLQNIFIEQFHLIND